MIYTLQKISEILNSKLFGEPSVIIDSLLIDSRIFIPTNNSLFFAIDGQRHDGHNFITDLYQKNVKNFVISKEIPEISKLKDANFILVDNSIDALQKLAQFHRQQFNIPIVGITGSNGKTIVKDWLSQLLENKKTVLKSPKSYNSQVGVPLSVWELNKNYECAIFEAGISQINEMDKLQQIIQPEIGIITNIGDAHQENFPDIETKINEKLKLFENSVQIFYCKDYQLIDNILRTNNKFNTKQLFSWSKTLHGTLKVPCNDNRQTRPDLEIQKIIKKNNTTKIQAIFKRLTDKQILENRLTDNSQKPEARSQKPEARSQRLTIKIPFTDDASIENAIHCLLFLLVQFPETINNEILKAKSQKPKAKSQFMKLLPVEMRMEQKSGINNCTIINDSYNCDFASLRIALDFLSLDSRHNKTTLILSDIHQVGKNQVELYSEISKILHKNNISRFIGIGYKISENSHSFQLKKHFYKTTEEFIENISNINFNNETILLKGAREFKFEKIANILQKKNHRTVFEINLQAVVHNLNEYRSLLKPDTKILVMVKAFAYGVGNYEIANILQHERIDYLGVAYTDEGVELRKAGINIPIIVMNPDTDNFNDFISYNLQPEIYSFDILEQFYTQLHGKINNSFPIHLKIETGMNRLGFVEADIPKLIHTLKKYNKLRVESIFSHLAGSPDSIFDEFTEQQISEFEKISSFIQKEFQYPIMQHLLNSAGIERFPKAQYDMVRLGIGLYGISAPKTNLSLQNIGTLKSRISQIKTVTKNQTIGYDRKGKVQQKTIIAIIPIGYADGLNRRLSNGKGKVLIKNKHFAPIIGNICMDMCMLDITNIPAKVNDEVIIFGDKYPVSKLASQLDTIPYEILTSIPQRVKRIYVY